MEDSRFLSPAAVWIIKTDFATFFALLAVGVDGRLSKDLIRHRVSACKFNCSATFFVPSYF